MTDNDELLQTAYNAAKDFENFHTVLMAISLHPEWLTLVPRGRKWTILHQIVLSGNVDILNRLLAAQKQNSTFRLMTETPEGETVLDIAKRRQDDKPQMLARIQRLVELDGMLNCAKDCKWDACSAIIQKHPEYVNEKPPYRRYYLIHHLVWADAIDTFHRFQEIKNCVFDLHLRADGKTIYTVAQEENEKSLEFIKYIEEKEPELMNEADDIIVPSAQAKAKTTEMSNILKQSIVLPELDQLINGSTKQETRQEYMERVARLEQQQRQRYAESNQATSTNSAQNKNFSVLNLIENLICPLTKTVFTDPVVAADGVTYEREAITTWLRSSSKSPVTNEELVHKELNPNLALSHILCAIYGKK